MRDRSAERAARAAILESRRSPETGIPKLQRLLSEDPSGEQADDLALALANARLAEGDEPRAIAALEAGLRGQPQGNRSDEIRLTLARLEQKRGRRETAYRVLKPVRLQNLTTAEKREALRLLASLAAARRDHAAEIVWLARLRAEAPDEDAVALIDVEIDERLGRLSRPELDQVARQLGNAVPAGRARIHQAELSIRLGELDDAGQALAQASALPLTGADARKLARVETELVQKGGKVPKLAREPAPETVPGDAAARTGEGGLDAVGVVLPLSGRFSRFGQESLNGILLAAGVFEDEAPGGAGRIRFVVRDSAAGPRAAEAAVQELAADPSVAAVIGPLLSQETESAASALGDADLPLLTLSAKVHEGAEQPHVFRFGATPRADVQALADHTVGRLGLRGFAVLYPEDDYGRGLRDLFDEEVRKRGGTLVKSVGYAPRTRDMGPAVQELIGAGPPTLLDAVFVADGRTQGAQAAQALRRAGAQDVRVLGARGWQSTELLRLGGPALDGALFAEPFDPADSSATVANFTRRYTQSFGRAPDVMAAQAYDATRVLLSAMPPGTTERSSVEGRLKRVQDYPGAAGTISVQPDGTVHKSSELRSVRGGRIVEVD